VSKNILLLFFLGEKSKRKERKEERAISKQIRLKVEKNIQRKGEK
jgi:hypothetical protein